MGHPTGRCVCYLSARAPLEFRTSTVAQVITELSDVMRGGGKGPRPRAKACSRCNSWTHGL